MTFSSRSRLQAAFQAARPSFVAGVGLLMAASAHAALIEPANGVVSPSVSLNTSGAVTGQTVLGQLTLSLPATTSTGQPIVVNQPFLLTLNSNFELTLWNFITTINAQQAGQMLGVAQGNMGNIQYAFNAPNNGVVPLPAAGWLFLSGLAGIWGLLRKRVRKALPSGERAAAQPHWPAGAAVS